MVSIRWRCISAQGGALRGWLMCIAGISSSASAVLESARATDRKTAEAGNTVTNLFNANSSVSEMGFVGPQPLGRCCCSMSGISATIQSKVLRINRLASESSCRACQGCHVRARRASDAHGPSAKRPVRWCRDAEDRAHRPCRSLVGAEEDSRTQCQQLCKAPRLTTRHRFRAAGSVFSRSMRLGRSR